MMKKFDSQRSVTFLYHGLCILIIMLFSACADGDDPVSHVSEASEVSETGSVAFRVVWKDVPDTESASGKTERKLNCAESDVETVEANVYDENDENGEPIADGGPWSCSLGKASIEDVPAGSQRRIVVRGKDSEDRVLHQGEAEDVRVLAGQSTPPVLIEMRRVAPEVFINSPSENKVFTEGETITFSGSATDPEDGGDLSLAWTISMGGESVDSATGTSFTRDNLAQGDYTAELTATDSGGLTDTASVMFTVKGNTPPSVTIIRPSANEVVFTEGETVTFSGSASDPEDGADLSLAWEIRQGDSLEYSTTEGSFSKNDLTSGTYTATLTATDSRGAPGSASISFIVNKGNQPPVLSEIGAQSVNEGELLRFSVSATDPDDGDMLTFTTGNLPDGVEFDKSEENPDTYIFSWTSYSNDIDYNVTFTVTDDGTPNRSDSETVMITVNKKPFVKITNPSGQESFFKGDEISFSGSAQDSEDVELSGENFRWEISQNTDPMHSDTGESFVKSDLGLGTYTVTLKVTDSGGAIGEASVSFTVQDQVVTFPDANLEAAIRVAIQKPDGDIYASDLEGLTELFAVGREIENLEGLEYCTNLTLLNLGTTGETSNSIADISPLTELTSLTSLGLGDNQISDISALASLTSLTSLGLRYNQISDISELASLTALTSLDLSYNQISDISPLVSNMGIGDGDNVYLGNNPLSDTSCAVYIPELEERGATVTHDCSDNFSPVLDAVGTQYVNEGQLLEFTLSATDPDADDILTFSAGSLPSGANLDSETRLFSWTPGFDAAGGYSVSFAVTDDGSPNLTNSKTATIIVVNTAQGNEITISTGIAEPGQTGATVTVTVSDHPNLRAATIEIGYNTADMTFKSGTVDVESWFISRIEEKDTANPGTVSIVLLDKQEEALPANDGDTQLVTLTFDILAAEPGSYPLTYLDSSDGIFDDSSEYVTTTNNNGEFFIPTD